MDDADRALFRRRRARRNEHGQGRPAELSLIEFEIKPGGGVEPHFHKGHSDSFFVLEGEVEFHVGDEVVHGSPGTYVLAPPGVVHFFRNVSDRAGASPEPPHAGRVRDVPPRARGSPMREGEEPDAAFFERHDIFDV